MGGAAMDGKDVVDREEEVNRGGPVRLADALDGAAYLCSDAGSNVYVSVPRPCGQVPPNPRP